MESHRNRNRKQETVYSNSAGANKSMESHRNPNRKQETVYSNVAGAEKHGVTPESQSETIPIEPEPKKAWSQTGILPV